MSQHDSWFRNARELLFDQLLLIAYPDEQDEHAQATELNEAIELTSSTGNIIMPPWLEHRTMSSFDKTVEKAFRGQMWSTAILVTQDSDCGSLRNRTIRLQLRSDLLLPSIRLKLGESESSKGAVIFELDPDVFGTTYEVIPQIGRRREPCSSAWDPQSMPRMTCSSKSPSSHRCSRLRPLGIEEHPTHVTCQRARQRPRIPSPAHRKNDLIPQSRSPLEHGAVCVEDGRGPDLGGSSQKLPGLE